MKGLCGEGGAKWGEGVWEDWNIGWGEWGKDGGRTGR